MAEPFLGEVRIMSFRFAPKGWALCNGQLLPINQNQALFSLLGTAYGGNGQTTFALPKLQDQVPIHVGRGFVRGQAGGEQTHTLVVPELAAHMHLVQGTSKIADQPVPGGNLLATVDVSALTTSLYAPAVSLVPMAAAAVSDTGGSQAHQNMQPFLTLSFCIALQGIYPSRN
jgi:microcystin-dependent protein